MSSKEKDSKTFPARLKDLFKSKLPVGNHSGKGEFNLTQDIIRDISKDAPLPTRLKTLKELCETVEKEKLANNVVEKLTSLTEDLFSKEHSDETRHLAFYFLQCMVKGQNERLSLMRAQFFRLIKHHDHPDDIGQTLDLLIALTSNGKVVLHFEQEIGRFLLNWLPEISRVGRIEEYLTMIDNVIRFNAAYLDEEIINGFIEHICLLCGPNSQYTTINLCLLIMSSIVAYSNMSPDALPKFIGALCRTVIDKKYCEKSWQTLMVIRILLQMLIIPRRNLNIRLPIPKFHPSCWRRTRHYTVLTQNLILCSEECESKARDEDGHTIKALQGMIADMGRELNMKNVHIERMKRNSSVFESDAEEMESKLLNEIQEYRAEITKLKDTIKEQRQIIDRLDNTVFADSETQTESNSAIAEAQTQTSPQSINRETQTEVILHKNSEIQYSPVRDLGARPLVMLNVNRKIPHTHEEELRVNLASVGHVIDGRDDCVGSFRDTNAQASPLATQSSARHAAVTQTSPGVDKRKSKNCSSQTRITSISIVRPSQQKEGHRHNRILADGTGPKNPQILILGNKNIVKGVPMLLKHYNKSMFDINCQFPDKPTTIEEMMEFYSPLSNGFSKRDYILLFVGTENPASGRLPSSGYLRNIMHAHRLTNLVLIAGSSLLTRDKNLRDSVYRLNLLVKRAVHCSGTGARFISMDSFMDCNTQMDPNLRLHLHLASDSPKDLPDFFGRRLVKLLGRNDNWIPKVSTFPKHFPSPSDALREVCFPDVPEEAEADVSLPVPDEESLLSHETRTPVGSNTCLLGISTPMSQIMKNLLGTHMGYSTIITMGRIMQEPALRSHIDLLRGAVFFTRMGLWTVDPFPNLRCPPSSILPSLLQAVKGNHPAVAYEVTLALQQLINRYRQELFDSSWSIILLIISHILHIANTEPNPHKVELKPILMNTMNTIENYIELGQYNGDLKSYYRLVGECAVDRPDESILRLLEHLSKSINPLQCSWMGNLYNLLHKYFRNDMRTAIRIKVLQILTDIFKLYREQYEEELIEGIVIPHMPPVINDNDMLIRTSVIKMLVEMCTVCDSKRCLELLDILEKFLLRPFDTPNPDSDYQDIACLVTGLTSLFVRKIHRLPSSHAVRIYSMLIAFLEKHYEMPLAFQSCRQIRYTIFDCFLKMRADSLYHLGYPEGNLVKFSPYLCVIYRSSLHSPPPHSPATTPQLTCNVTYVSLRRAFKLIITCLESEKDWEVLNLVLSGITKGLQNKSLVLGKGNNELDLLVKVLCSMVSDKHLPDSLNVKINKPDFHSTVSLALVNLASYHFYLDNPSQTKMIRCIMKCIQSAPKSSKPCISALTICTLEMKEVMVKILPEVLLSLSKMSPTNHVAVPVLEFLSTMTQLPTIFANFVADQYMAVFAVALPYSNPFKFNHYIVSLAHHVIAVWFLKCRLTFRRDFVRFIINGLKTNLQTNEDTLFFKTDLSSINQDSSDRKRSSSLTEQGSRRRDERSMPVRMVKGVIKKDQAPNKVLTMFYEDLNETCIDLMARYAFSPCTALPRRLPGAEFLLNGGQSMTWLVGNKLVTVSTSGCSQKVLKHGLCDKCWSMCNTKTDDRLLTTGSSSAEPSRQNSNEKSNNSVSSPQDEGGRFGEEVVTNKLQEMFKTDEGREEKYTCACWCQGWAEVYIRRPTGDMSWIMRIQNDISHTHNPYDFPLNEVSTLYMPSLFGESPRPLLVRQDTFDDNHSNGEDDVASGQGSPRQTPSRQNSQDSIEEENDEIMYEDGSRSRNPVRRSNSSPEMSAGWKNPFLKMGSSSTSSEGDSIEEKKGKMYSKDMRVSCEAIPEEIAGTSPPQSEITQSATTSSSSNHPSLLSYHSCPGSSLSSDSVIVPKLHQAVSSGGIQERPTTLPCSIGGLQPLAGKPPQSPTQTSPRLARHANKGGQELQKSSSSSVVLDRNSHFSQARERARERKNSGSTEKLASLEPNQSQTRRDRVHTISVMSPPNRKPRSEPVRHPTRTKEVPRSGVNPSFVFLQLYHTSYFNDHPRVEKPLLIGTSDVVNRAVKILDTMPPYETHTVGVLYIREGQVNNEVEILKNSFGSLRYVRFLQNLGTLVKISDVDPQVLGGLDQNGGDGKFVFIWQDDVVRVTFHIATMMPNKDTDVNCNNKKMHIGNDHVNIIYNESGEEFDMKTIKSQFNFACIIIQPLDHNINRVVVKIKDELKDLAVVGNDAKVVSDQNVAILARQLALHANLASLVARSLKSNPNGPYASNWLERLRQIKNVRKKVIDELKNEEQSNYPSEESKSRRPTEDFTDYS